MSIRPADLGAFRERIRNAAVNAGVSHERLGDLTLAASELMSNACEHGVRACVAIVRVGKLIELRVTNTASPGSVPPPSAWSFPAPESATGRGLAVVGAVADATRVTWNHNRVTVSAAFSVQ